MKLLQILLVITLITPALSQDIQINRQNKTIAVTADDSVEVAAEVAVLAIGYDNYGATQDLAFQDNVRMSNSISTALMNAGVPKNNIETEKLELRRTELDEKWAPEMKKERQFAAQQSWRITVAVAQAQAVVDLAIKSGANNVEDAQWDVADPVALQAKAGSAALAKARRIAEQMAAGLNAKLGDLVYASNRAPVSKFFRNVTLDTAATAISTTTGEKPKLRLFPHKVRSESTVYAVFAIE